MLTKLVLLGDKVVTRWRPRCRRLNSLRVRENRWQVKLQTVWWVRLLRELCKDTRSLCKIQWMTRKFQILWWAHLPIILACLQRIRHLSSDLLQISTQHTTQATICSLLRKSQTFHLWSSIHKAMLKTTSSRQTTSKWRQSHSLKGHSRASIR